MPYKIEEEYGVRIINRTGLY